MDIHVNKSTNYLLFALLYLPINKVSKKANIMNQCNQVQHNNSNTSWESDKNVWKHHIQESQEVSPSLAGDHKAAMNRQESMTNINNKKRSTKRQCLGMVSKVIFTGGLKLVLLYQPHPYFKCESRQIDVWFAWKIPNKPSDKCMLCNEKIYIFDLK